MRRAVTCAVVTIALISSVPALHTGFALAPAPAPEPGTGTGTGTGASSDAKNTSRDEALLVSPDKPAHPKLASGLVGETGVMTAGFTAYRITVTVQATPGNASAVSRAIRARGGVVTAQIEGRVQATLPRQAVTGIAGRSDVAFVHRPRYARPTAADSSGLDAVNATAVHSNGIAGENVTVAVIGTSFNADAAPLADDVTATRSFGSDGFDNPNTHGTAVAELVSDTAPNASIVLVEIDTMTEFAKAADWVDRKTDADVAVASLGWPIGPFDGETALGRQIRQGIRNDTQWMLAAGNSGNKGHLRVRWRNADGDRWLEFSGSDQTAAIRSATGRVRVYLNWNDWPRSSADYDAYLFAWNGSAWTLTAASETTQSGSQPPFEALSASGASRYQLLVRNYDAAGDATFDVFVNDGAALAEYADSRRSIMRPATVEPALSVGAVAESTLELEPYSSRGPTVDGALKPELVAPDRVSTAAYDRSFPGTSAAAPHVAGVAALVVDASDDRRSASALRRTLLSSTHHLRASEPNNQTGYGLVDAESAIDALDTVYLDSCATIDAGGRYVLTENVSTANGSCIRVTSSDVTVDGNGHTIRASGAAVSVDGSVTNVTVVDVRLAGNPDLATNGGEVTRRNVSG